MPREWKPGDVARLRTSLQEFAVVALFDGKFWNFAGGCSRPEIVWDVRPLVVIDPEGREQVERIRDYLDVECDWHGMSEDNTVENLQAALCSLLAPVAPPMPPEPSGLGAVIEDADGVRWTLTMNPDHSDAKPWVRDHLLAHGLKFADFADINVARVLSEGVA